MNIEYPSNPISGHTPTDQCVKQEEEEANGQRM